jgi:hypothetical protein
MYFGGPIRNSQRDSPVTGSLALDFSSILLAYYCNRYLDRPSHTIVFCICTKCRITHF